MLRVSIAQAKARFSDLLHRVKAGEHVIITERNVPIIELRPVHEPRTAVRSLEPVWPGWNVPDSFFEPLSEETLDAFGSERHRTPPTPG
jgi:prevent-host-death family protein